MKIKPRNKKGFGPISVGLDLLIEIILFGILFVFGIYVTEGIAVADVEADSMVMSIGSVFDTVSGVSRDIVVISSCPAGRVFRIDGDKITLVSSSILTEERPVYHYLHENGAILPVGTTISCSVGGTFTITKQTTLDANNNPIITITAQ